MNRKPKSKPLSRRRGRPRADTLHAVPEARVLDLAFQAFARRGYEGTTLRSLAKQLGVSHNLLNVRFGTKSNLWRRAVDARVARPRRRFMPRLTRLVSTTRRG